MQSVIIYYSYSGNTKKIAEMVQRETGFRTAEQRTVVPYSENYDVVADQGQDEVKRGFMPEILPLEVDPEEYGTVFLGTPVWWYTFAPAVKTFLAQYKLAGKTILPFATNGGEDIQRRAGRPSFPVIQADRATGKRDKRHDCGMQHGIRRKKGRY